MKFQHIGLYLNNKSDKKFVTTQIFDNKLLRHQIDLFQLRGALFSTVTIEKMIDEEYRHDRVAISTNENSSLSTMSSGQQKKALLAYLIAQKPDYLVLDDVYSNVDKATQEYIRKAFETLSETMLIIQLFYRHTDVLTCIDRVITIDAHNRIFSIENTEAFILKHKSPTDNQLNRKDLFLLPSNFSSITIRDNNCTKTLEIENPLIDLRSINVKYGNKQVLTNLSWTINKGEFWQLQGPNGSGKSTLVSMICGDNPKAYHQDMWLFGRKKGTGETIWDIKQNIGYFTPVMMAQFTRNDTVENMIISGLNDSVGLYVEPSDLQTDMAKSWIKLLGQAFENKLFQQLSIGQQRMVMVARAMVKYPPLLILDEPTIELDDENTALFIEMIQAIAADKHTAIIYISHRDEESLQPRKIFELIKTANGYTGIEK